MVDSREGDPIAMDSDPANLEKIESTAELAIEQSDEEHFTSREPDCLDLCNDEDHPYIEHIGGARAYVRDIILGLNDGLVSTFLLIVGVLGGGQERSVVLLTAITGALAGAISMAFGELMATKSQNQMTKGELKLERDHIRYHRHKEIDEVRDALESVGLTGELLEQATKTIGESEDGLLRFMEFHEFAISKFDLRSPWKAMLTSGLLFLTGSLPSVIPAACTSNTQIILIVSAVLAALSLFLVGFVKGIACRTNKWISGTENFLVGAVGGGIVYCIGLIFQHAG